MRTITVALAFGTAMALWTAAHAETRVEVRRVLHRVPVRVPVLRADPYWVPDYYIVPRYHYRPEDDRVDTSPYAPPVASGDVEPGGSGIGQ
jgi:hypothetical protein